METYHGHVRTPADAIVLFEACRLGQLPRVQRRLSEKERQSIKSGSVFVWDEREAGMRRWTDGKSWSASRVSGSFLTYREMEGKRGGSNYAPPLSRAGKTPDSTRGSDSDMDLGGDEGPDGYRYKPDGLMKQSFSITTSTGNHLHLISYYTRAHPIDRPLQQPTQDSNLRHIRPATGMYPESTVHEQQNIPAVTRSPMAGHLTANAQQPAFGGRPAQPPPHGLAYSQHPYGHGHAQWQGPAATPAGAGYNPYAPSGPPPMWPQPQQVPFAQSMPPVAQSAVTSAPAMDGHHPRPQAAGHHRTSSGGSYAQYTPGRSPHTGVVSLAPHLTASQHTSQTSSPASTPPMSQIDPRLMNPSPLAQHQSLPPVTSRSHTRTPSPGPMNLRDFSTPPRDSIGPPTSTIPSIGALMNGANERIAAARSRSASRSPNGSRKEGPQDIPHDKLGFREDMRALRVLDRAFKT